MTGPRVALEGGARPVGSAAGVEPRAVGNALAPGVVEELHPPPRAVLLAVAALTQLSCGACLLMGTIGLVLVQQHQVGSLGIVAAWLVAAMAGLVCGGLIYRGGRTSMVAAAVLDAGFGVALISLDRETLQMLLKILPASDIATISIALHVAGYAMIGFGALCLAALPQGIRYAAWFREAAAANTAMSTARGFPPPPVPVGGSAYIIPAEDRPASRRRLYIVLGSLAIAVGTGAGILVSSAPPAVRAPDREAAPTERAPFVVKTASEPAPVVAPPPAAEPSVAPTPAEPSVATPVAATEPPPAEPADTVQRLLGAQRAAISAGDSDALAALMSPAVFGIGMGAEDIAEGKAAVAAQLVAALGAPPAGGFTVESRAQSIGGERDHAWIAEDLVVGPTPRRISITELAARVDGRWQIVALHWAAPLDDATAERLAILGTLPTPHPIADRAEAPDAVAAAVRAAFGTRAAFAAARSPRPDAFNLGSGGERVLGGATIKRLFGRLKAQIRMHDGVRIAAGGAWDPAQRGQPWIAWAALNVDFTAKTRAATELTQTFRVLAVLVAEGGEWKLVQTHWSNAGR